MIKNNLFSHFVGNVFYYCFKYLKLNNKLTMVQTLMYCFTESVQKMIVNVIDWCTLFPKHVKFIVENNDNLFKYPSETT